MAVDQNGRPLPSPRARAEAEALSGGALGSIIGDRRARRGDPWATSFNELAERDDIAETWTSLVRGSMRDSDDAMATIRWWLFRRLRMWLARAWNLHVTTHGDLLIEASPLPGSRPLALAAATEASAWAIEMGLAGRIAIGVVETEPGVWRVLVERIWPYPRQVPAERERLMRGMPWADRPFFDRPGSSADDDQ